MFIHFNIKTFFESVFLSPERLPCRPAFFPVLPAADAATAAEEEAISAEAIPRGAEETPEINGKYQTVEQQRKK